LASKVGGLRGTSQVVATAGIQFLTQTHCFGTWAPWPACVNALGPVTRLSGLANN